MVEENRFGITPEQAAAVDALLRQAPQQSSQDNKLWQAFCRTALSLPGPWRSAWSAHWMGASTLVSQTSMAAALLDLLKSGRSVPAAAAAIDDVLRAPQLPGAFLTGIAGVVFTGDGPAIGDVSFLPASCFDDRRGHLDGLERVEQPVTACVRVQVPVLRPFTEGDLSTGEGPSLEGYWQQEGAHATKTEIVALLRLLAFPAALLEIGTYFEFDDRSAARISGSAAGRVRDPFQLSRFPASPVPIPAAAVHGAWANLLRLDPKRRSSMLLACERIGRSAAHVRLQDRCIDACIALEALLAGNEGEGATYKIVRRCARLLRPDFATRAALGRDLQQAVALRGKLVHGNAIVPPTHKPTGITLEEWKQRQKKWASNKTCVDALASAAVEAAKKLLELPAWPTDDDLDYA